MNKELWALVPASGVGSRMKADRPKQYLTLNNRTVLDLTLHRLLSVPNLSGIMLVLSDEDEYWPSSQYASHPKVHCAVGGLERFHSVLNGLYELTEIAADDAWVMVHDAARPCVRVSDIEKLFDLASQLDGGLLGIPAKDTVKQVNLQAEVSHTLDRSKIWLAYTPQMFRLGQLRDAIEQAISKKIQITDDASAMELAGFSPLMVEGATDNIKITHPEDLSLAEWFLTQQRAG
ncbi:2-C-methyl-D-erythritol 4-phosphate cytidylyltransferase [Litoribrevibacter albus]|uniref:2-C-methyl-D-erythritol 4-phosphate cytidylyltransferase n=1 Tax=Litoribrevibacter albus TaxID=1473156 RepID=A0AA37SAJ7_9GAMM|nr:2-C-methyl-D-erythritol 4-phosphate cytidylyltransferase [Litoribrevibacter albus]GLQ31157.1 2-C-methyl-D-erythritol 4-phosphate cytidylyltransferase [Litoribrevibacter albus]